MFITRKHIPRRTFLRGAGTMLALPLLDAMVPALSAIAKTPAKPVSRLGFHRTNTQTKVLLPARRRPRSKPVSVPRLPEPHRSDWFSLTVSS